MYSSGLPRTYIFVIFFLLLGRSTHQNKPRNGAANQFNSPKMDPKETEALFEVMESISTDAVWRKAHPKPCINGVWPGLECKLGADKLMHVTRLDFGYKPNPSCKKNAIFPSSIFKLQHLQGLFMFQCFMHTHTTIPTGFQNLAPSLQQLSLRANTALSGEIPSELGSLKALQVLTLSQNSLHGFIPQDLGKLSALLHLDLSYNSLNGPIPGKIGSLRVLKGLDLSYNNLRGPISPLVGNLKMLQKLDLSSNSLTGHIPVALGSLKSMEFIALSNNKFTGMFPPSLVNLQSLQYFIMDNNPMNFPLPAEFGSLRRLQELRLANSGYSGPIPVSYGKLLNLSSLSLENNRVSGSIPPSLGNLSHIYHLNLSGNLLSGPVPFSTEFLHRLGKNIDLKGNVELCINASHAAQSYQYLGVGICGSPLLNPKLKSSKKSQGFSLHEMHWRMDIYILGSWILYLLLACK
ncbi:hypothetical protein SUGI_0780340 [Cryptomeria japonica]|uniref:receptor like protein 29 n=1 Tax=Cryptomeria japonica TaxID=3369 RepID=UPI002414B6C4|nr:receptor like protein 29 [Cryptomeria japonica]GLJ38318.1 hypothetical protein SUGI_0780340 [Cryptomeria japonica]